MERQVGAVEVLRKIEGAKSRVYVMKLNLSAKEGKNEVRVAQVWPADSVGHVDVSPEDLETLRSMSVEAS